jgi:chondroitin-sulfate-ABC endolyase/exolyase
MQRLVFRLLNLSASLFRGPLLAGIALFASIAASYANVWPIEDLWLPIGSTTLSDIPGSYNNGDGAAGETMLLVDGTTSSGPQGVTYDFRGVLTSGEALSVIVRLVNPNAVECRLKIDFYNATDSRVISTSPEIVLAPNSTQSVTLSMTATSPNASDALQLRLIRSDDLATTRDFAIDSASLDGYYFPRTSNNSKTPDLPLLANDPALQADVDRIKNDWYEAQMGTLPPAARLATAMSDYNARGITNINGVVTGNITSFPQTDYLPYLARALYNNDPNHVDYATWLKAVNDTVKLVAQNMLRGTLNTGDGYSWDIFTRPAVLLADFLDQAAKDSLNYVLDGKIDIIWRANYEGPDSVENPDEDPINTDQIYTFCDTFMIFSIAMQRNNLEAQRWALGFKRYCERFATPSRGNGNGIKRDGSGFHHASNYENYMYAYNTFIDVLDALDNTQVQIGESYYLNFRDAAVAQFARTRSDIRAFSLCGRKPYSLNVTVTDKSLRKLALAGGRILGLAPNTPDPEVAKVYNYLYPTDAFPGVPGTNPMEGAFQFSYAHLGVYRQSNWTAAMRGFGSNLWGSEIYFNSNRYGRYQSYGSLQIIYEGTQASNGINVNGWDWNYQPGTTTIALPFEKLNAEMNRIDEKQSKRFAGFGTLGNKGSALLNRVHGTYGVFGMDFQEREGQGFDGRLGPETHNNTFVFKKSVFTFDGLLIAMGSNIANDDSTNHTVTTLFQHTAATGTNVVNGTSYTSVGQNTFATNTMRWVLDRMGTGYYVPSANNNLILSRVSQSTPPHDLIDRLDTASYTQGTFSKLYLDHGTAPSSGGYEYVAIPGTTATAMDTFATQMNAADAGSRPYRVMANDGNKHVVKYQGNGKEVWGLCLFVNVVNLHPECIVRANTGASLVMYEKHYPSSITLSVTNPDLTSLQGNLPALESNVVLKLAGEWMAASGNTNITLAFANGQTTLTATLKDGLPQEIALKMPPVFTANPISKATATEDSAYTGQTLAGSTTDGDAEEGLTYSKVAGPAWLNIASDGTLTGTPGNSDVGENSFTVSVSNGIAAPVQATLNITVIAKPAITVLFCDDFNAANGTSLTAPGSRATGTLAASVPYVWSSTTGVVVDGTLNWDNNGSRDSNNEQTDATSSQKLTLDFDWAPHVLGKVWEVAFDQRVAWYHTLTFALSDDSQPGDWFAWDNASYDFAAGSYGAALRYDTDNERTTVLGAVSGVFPQPPNSVDMHHFRIRLDEPNQTAKVWINGALKVTMTTLDFENAGRYLSWVERANYGGALDNLVVQVINANSTPVFAANPVNGSNATEDAAYAATLAGSASDYDGEALTYAKVSGSAWLSIASNGALSGTPATSDVGANSFTVSVSDGISSVTTTLQITVQASGYLGWLAAFPSISGSTPETDSDYDGVRNLLEYALGGNPIILDATTVLPQVQATPSGGLFTFHRSDTSEIDTKMTFQYSDDLGTQTAWTDVAIGATTSGPDPSGIEVTVEENGSDLDFIRVTIPVGFMGRIFGRIYVSLTP